MEVPLISSSFSNAAVGVDAPLVENIVVQRREQLLGHESYIADIGDNYRQAEKHLRPTEDYLACQMELGEDMRWDVADWLIRAHHCLELIPETLYSSFYILDRYLSLQDVPAAALHRVGVCALFIAAKYQERQCVLDDLLVCSLDERLTETMIMEEEKHILNKLQWRLTAPTTYEFLTMFLNAGACGVDEEMQCAAFFFGELGLMDYSSVARPPSLQAASALYAARRLLGRKPLWPEQLAQETKYSEPQLLESAQSLVSLHARLANAENKKPRAVHEKYSSADLKCVSLRPLAPERMAAKKSKSKRSFVRRAFGRCNERAHSLRHNMIKAASCFKP